MSGIGNISADAIGSQGAAPTAESTAEIASEGSRWKEEKLESQPRSLAGKAVMRL
jgi:hypothetical protein